MQILCHRGGCAKSINSTGAGANPEDVIFNRFKDIGRLWGSVYVLMRPRLSTRVGGVPGVNRVQVVFSV